MAQFRIIAEDKEAAIQKARKQYSKDARYSRALRRASKNRKGAYLFDAPSRDLIKRVRVEDAEPELGCDECAEALEQARKNNQEYVYRVDGPPGIGSHVHATFGDAADSLRGGY